MKKLRFEPRPDPGSASSHPRVTGAPPSSFQVCSVGSEPQNGEGMWELSSNPILPPKAHLLIPYGGNLPLDKNEIVKVLVTQFCLTLMTPMDCSPPGSSVPGDSPGKNTGVGFHPLLQGIFSIQRSKLCLLHCRQILYHLSQCGSPALDSLWSIKATLLIHHLILSPPPPFTLLLADLSPSIKSLN